MSVLLDVKDLKKYFKTARGLLHAVDGVSFTIEQGKTLGIVGESGCGKSTLGRVIVQLLDATDGQILFEGRNVTNLRGHDLKIFRKNMQMIFQDPFSSLNPRMTVAQAIAEPLRNYPEALGGRNLDEYIHAVMDTVGLAQRLRNSYPHELDGGRRQRIGIARALALNPKFIVCDEPVSALDVSIQAQILNLLRDLQKELDLTCIFIGHGLGAVNYVSDRIAVMYLGRIVEMAPARRIFEAPVHPYTRALFRAIPSTDPRRRSEGEILEGEVAFNLNPPSGCPFHPRCPYRQPECAGEAPGLLPLKEEGEHLAACPVMAKSLGKE